MPPWVEETPTSGPQYSNTNNDNNPQNLFTLTTHDIPPTITASHTATCTKTWRLLSRQHRFTTKARVLRSLRYREGTRGEAHLTRKTTAPPLVYTNKIDLCLSIPSVRSEFVTGLASPQLLHTPGTTSTATILSEARFQFPLSVSPRIGASWRRFQHLLQLLQQLQLLAS